MTDITGGTDALEGVDTSGADQATHFDDGSSEPAAPASEAPSEEAEAEAAAAEEPSGESDADRFRSHNREIAADIAEARADLEGEERGEAAAAPGAGDGGEPKTEATEGSASEGGETSPDDAAGATEPFSHWSEAAKTTFQSQTPEARQWMLDREREFGEALSRGTDIAKDMIQVMAPYSQQLARAGMSPADGLRRLVAAHDLIEKDPRAGLAYLVDLYDIDLNNISNQAASESLDPEVNELKTQIGDLTKTVSSLTQTNQTTQEHNLQAHIAAFASEKDAAGNVKRPFFEEVRVTMAGLIETAERTGQQVSMDDAYQAAVYANPATRARAIAMHTGVPQPTPAQTASDAVKKAKRAAGGQVSSGTADSARVSSEKEGGNSLRDDLRTGFRAMLDA